MSSPYIVVVVNGEGRRRRSPCQSRVFKGFLIDTRVVPRGHPFISHFRLSPSSLLSPLAFLSIFIDPSLLPVFFSSLNFQVIP